MGYFDGLANGNFKKDKNGNTVFFPWRGFGKGRVLPDETTEIELREFMSRYYKVTLITVVCVSALLDWTWIFLLVPIDYIWLDLGTRSFLSGCPFSDEKLSLKDTWENSVASVNKFTLWLLLACCALFVLAGILIASTGESFSQMLAGGLTVAFFGACAAVFGFMLKLKYA